MYRLLPMASALLALLAPLACNEENEKPAAVPQRLRGFVVFGNELLAFQTCGSPRLLWLDLQGGELGLEKLSSARSASCVGVSNLCGTYAEIEGVVSAPCACGHSGK